MSEIKHDSKDIEENKVVAALSYISILVFVPLFLKRGSAFAQFHAKQGLILFIAEIIGWAIMFIPIIGQIWFVLTIILAILGIKNALSGKYWQMPILGKYSSKLNL